jgi:Fe-S oxidoreductase
MHLKEREREVWACAFCNSMCRHVCSVASVAKLESTQPKGKGLIAYSILRGEGGFSEGAIERMYMCADCGRCRVWCMTGISDCSENVQAARADIVELGKAPASISKWNENALRYGSLYEVPVDMRFNGIGGLPGPTGEADTLYFVGCTTARYHPEVAEATLEALRGVGDRVTLSAGEVCCGYPLWVAGFRETAKKLARENAEAFKKLRVKRIVTSCPECYLALKDRYRDWGAPIDVEVFHITKYLDERGYGPRSQKGVASATYHDPCHLGRRGGIYEEPRRLLAKVPGLSIKEMRGNRENSPCCGGGGGLQATYPWLSKAICDRALAAAQEIGVEAIVTACPFCKQALSEGIGRKALNMKVYDITELLAPTSR